MLFGRGIVDFCCFAEVLLSRKEQVLLVSVLKGFY